MLPASTFAGTVSFNAHEDLLATLAISGLFLLLAFCFHMYGFFKYLIYDLNFEIDLDMRF